MHAIYIPKDPRSEKIKYLTGLPDVLENRISEEDWDTTINDINHIIDQCSVISFASLIYNLLIIPFFFVKNTNLENNLEKYLQYKNSILNKCGIYVCHPKICHYNELRVVIVG